MSNLFARAITGSLVVASIIFLVLWGEYGVVLLVNSIAYFGCTEYLKMMKKDLPFISPYRDSIYYFIITVIFSLVLLGIIPEKYLLLTALVPGVFLIQLLYTNYTAPFNHFSYWAGGLMYWVLPVSSWLLFADNSMTGPLLLTLFITIWVSDTMAYLVGSLVGRTKLFERVSPNKTVEGFIGSLIFASLAGYLIALYYDEHYLYFILRGFGIAIIGTMGDLIESILKRSMKVKDSGSIFPGHGGVLDRFDAVVFSSPFVLLGDILYFS